MAIGRDFGPGGRTLALLAHDLTLEAVSVLADNGPLRQAELEQALGDPPRATLRNRLLDLAAVGAVERRDENGSQRVVYELTASGRGLPEVTGPLVAWLDAAPTGPAPPTAVRAAVDAWNAGILRELAVEPRSSSELAERLTSISHDALRLRVRRLAHTGQIEPVAARGRRKPYRLTDWGRLAIAPIAAATRWEQERAAVPLGSVEIADATAALLLAAPLVDLPRTANGVCALTVEASDGSGGTEVTVEQGRLVGSVPLRPGGRPAAWVHGTTGDWLAAVIEDDPGALRITGDADLAGGIVRALHRRLYGDRR